MIPNPYPGAFFVVEGIGGSGKTTQANFLAEWLNSLGGLRVEVTKEPNRNTTYGEQIYRDLENPQGLHVRNPHFLQSWYAMSSRENARDHVVRVISSKVGVIISERYRPSLIYGAKTVRDLPGLMATTQAIMGEYFFWPDKVFILDVPAQTAYRRLKERGIPLGVYKTLKKLDKARRLYQAFSSRYPNCVIVRGDEDPASVARSIRKIANDVLRAKGELALTDRLALKK